MYPKNEKNSITVHAFTFNPFQENTYVLSDEQGRALVVDPGCWNRVEQEELTDHFEANNLEPVHLLNTHAHLDHVLGNRFVHNRFGLPLESHREGVPVLEMAAASAQMYGIPGYDPSPEITVFWEEGDSIPFGNGLEVRFVPGHCPGHIALVSHADRFVIAGDVLFRGSIGRTDLPGGDFDLLEKNIREKMYTLPDDYTVYCGHGPETTIGEEKRSNPFVQAQ